MTRRCVRPRPGRATPRRPAAGRSAACAGGATGRRRFRVPRRSARRCGRRAGSARRPTSATSRGPSVGARAVVSPLLMRCAVWAVSDERTDDAAGEHLAGADADQEQSDAAAAEQQEPAGLAPRSRSPSDSHTRTMFGPGRNWVSCRRPHAPGASGRRAARAAGAGATECGELRDVAGDRPAQRCAAVGDDTARYFWSRPFSNASARRWSVAGGGTAPRRSRGVRRVAVAS